jgi:hypothetical protein
MATKLEKIANIAVILACGVFSSVYGMDLYHRLRPASPNLPYKAGETIKDTADLSLNRARMTMVLVTGAAVTSAPPVCHSTGAWRMWPSIPECGS